MVADKSWAQTLPAAAQPAWLAVLARAAQCCAIPGTTQTCGEGSIAALSVTFHTAHPPHLSFCTSLPASL